MEGGPVPPPPTPGLTRWRGGGGGGILCNCLVPLGHPCALGVERRGVGVEAPDEVSRSCRARTGIGVGNVRTRKGVDAGGRSESIFLLKTHIW